RPSSTLHRYSAPALIAAALAALLTLAATAQSDGQEYRILPIGGQQTMSGYLTCWLDLAPDQRTIGLSSTQGFPFRSFTVDDELSVDELDIGNWYAGARARFSPTGKYLLLQQLFYLDFAPNKDRPLKYEVVDVRSKQTVVRFQDLFAAALTPDEGTVLTLDKSGVKFVDLATHSAHAL